MFGILNLDKPAGFSSRQALNAVSRYRRRSKFGHAGTLDPLATGVLVVCCGPATRLVPYVQRLPKVYVGRFRVGFRSSSDDIENELQAVAGAPVTEAQLRSALPKFVGRVMQRPPAFSALKVDGRRAYRLARAGKSVELPEREVDIHELDLVDFVIDEEGTVEFELRIMCGAGTYIRSVGRDIAQSLGNSAVMVSLRRTAIGPFEVEHAVVPGDLGAENLERHLISPVQALHGVSQLVVDADEIQALVYGKSIERPVDLEPGTEVAAVDGQRRLIAVLQVTKSGPLKPAINFAQYWASQFEKSE